MPRHKSQVRGLGQRDLPRVHEAVWPDSLRELGISNASTAGDLIEALLGWHYILTIERGQTMGDLANDTIEMLELGAVAVCALWEAT